MHGAFQAGLWEIGSIGLICSIRSIGYLKTKQANSTNQTGFKPAKRCPSLTQVSGHKG